MREEGPSLPIPAHLAPRPAQAFGNRRRRRRRVGELAALQRHRQRHQQSPSAGIIQALYFISVQRRVSSLLLRLHPRRVPWVSLRDTRCNRRTFPRFLRSSVLILSISCFPSPPFFPFPFLTLFGFRAVLSCLFGSCPLCGLLRFPFTEGHVESTCVARVNKHTHPQALIS